MKNVSPVEKFEYMEQVWLSDLPVKTKNIICFLIKQYRDKEGYAWPDTAMLAKVTSNSDSKNVNRLLKQLPADLVTIEYKDGLNNRYFLNWENINKLENKEVRTNFTKRTRQPSSIGRSTLLTSENNPPQSGESVLPTEEPNSYNNSYNNSDNNSDRDDAALTSPSNALSEDSPLLSINTGSAVVPPSSLVPVNEEVVDLYVDEEDTTVTDPPQTGELEVPGEEMEEAGGEEEELIHSIPEHTREDGTVTLLFRKADVTRDNVIFYLHHMYDHKENIAKAVALVNSGFLEDKWRNFDGIHDAARQVYDHDSW